MGWIFYEKGYVMMAGIITAILGSLIGSGLFQLFSDSLVGGLIFATLGAVLAVFIGIALLIHYVRKNKPN
ncbi:hypothetical protein [Bacteroides coprosuis]|nr:hypothetical protein [Bacteroides coprosuis]HJD91453.1 CalY family protein [Bacteroides coprosuis]